MTFCLLVVFVLILVGVLVLIAVLVVILSSVLVIILGTVAILIVHNLLPSSLKFAGFRYSSIPACSGFILGLKQKAC